MSKSTWKDLKLRRKKGYAPKLVQCDLGNVIKNVDDIFADLEADKQRQIKCFDFGILAAHKYSNVEFDQLEFETWRLEGGIQQIWDNRKVEFDGLIVLSAITANSLSDNIIEAGMFLHDAYSTALVQQLVMHYGFETCDDRLKTKSLRAPLVASVPYARVIYIVYKLKKPDSTKTVSDTEDDSSDNTDADIITDPSYTNLLISERKTYAAKLALLTNRSTFGESFGILAAHIDSILDEIEKSKQRKIRTFTIGQTFARKKKIKKFNPYDFSTWRLANGVNQRWNSHYSKEGYDGLIVICGITRSILPRRILEMEDIDQVFYAKALEQRLIQYYAFEKVDKRLGNTSFNVGSYTKAIAGVVYVAYKLSEVEE